MCRAFAAPMKELKTAPPFAKNKTAKGGLPNIFSSLKIEPPVKVHHQIAARHDDVAVRPHARALPDRFEHLESRGSLDRVNPDALGGVS